MAFAGGFEPEGQCPTGSESSAARQSWSCLCPSLGPCVQGEGGCAVHVVCTRHRRSDAWVGAGDERRSEERLEASRAVGFLPLLHW